MYINVHTHNNNANNNNDIVSSRDTTIHVKFSEILNQE